MTAKTIDIRSVETAGHPSGRPRLTAAALILAPALTAIGDLLAGVDASSAHGVLQAVAATPERFFLSRAVFYLGMVLLLPGIITLLRLAPIRGRQWATTGAIMAGIGAIGYGGGEFMLGSAIPMLADSAIERSQAVVALDTAQNSLLGAVPFMLAPLVRVGLSVLGVAVMRSGSVSRTLGAAAIATPLLWLVASAGSYYVGAIGALPVVATYILVVLNMRPKLSPL